jgi:hypothetical protein
MLQMSLLFAECKYMYCVPSTSSQVPRVSSVAPRAKLPGLRVTEAPNCLGSFPAVDLPLCTQRYGVLAR